MPARGEPLDLNCDAPPYRVVQACRAIGLKSPEDVRWLEAGGLLARRGERVGSPVYHYWNERRAFNAAGSCSCGGELPFLEGYLFVLSSGAELLIAFGQCGRCNTIYWTRG